MSYLPIYLDAGLSLAEKFSLSGEMLLRGMGTVFMVLVILWGCLSLFKVFSAPEKPAKTPAPKPEAKSAPAVSEKKPEAAPATVEEVPAQTDDGAVIAAICAAIEAYRAEEGLSGLPYRVVSFKRKNGRKGWSGGNED